MDDSRTAQTSECALGCHRNATHFCYCEFSDTFLCTEHIATHAASHSSDQHFCPLPLTAFAYHHNFGYYDRLRSRQEGWEAGLNALQQNLKEVEKCLEEFGVMMENRIWLLAEFTIRKTAELERWKQSMNERIKTAIQLAEACFYEDNPELSDPLARVLRSYVPGSDTLRLFSYALDPTQLPSVSGNVLVTELLEPKEMNTERISKMNTLEGIAPQLIRIEDQAISLFDFSQNRWKAELSLNKSVARSGHRFCLQSDTEVFLSGGKDDAGTILKSSFEIDFQGRVTCKPDMSIERSLHGLVYYAGIRYVFGGETTHQTNICHASNQAERLELGENTWKQLPEMQHARKSFQPAVWRLSIYLCGGEQQLSIEVFELETWQMRELTLALPESSNATLAWTQGDELAILGKNWFLRLGWMDGQMCRKERSQHGNGTDPYSRGAPVLRGSQVFVSSGLKCVVYAAESGKKIKEF